MLLNEKYNYYPFGMLMPERSYASPAYRYGFNGKENDNEVKGEGNQQDYGFRISDSRLGRFLSVDPIANQYPELTPFQYASDCPVKFVDIDGKEAGEPGYGAYRAALTIQNSEAAIAEKNVMKNLGPPIMEYLAKSAVSTVGAFTRIGSGLAWGISSGYYYGATGKNLPPFVQSVDLKRGFYNVGNPESEENLKETFKASLDVGMSTLSFSGAKYTENEILNEVIGEGVSKAKDVAFDKLTSSTESKSPQTNNENQNNSTNSVKEYTVKKGDSLSAIAKMMKTTVNAIAEKNNIKNVDKIRVGQKLQVAQ